MRFRPARCPHSPCPSTSTGHFRYRHKGRYRRLCDGRFVQRFLCLECRRTFSTQTFRLDHRLKLPNLHLQLFPGFVSKVTHRQAARTSGCSRKTVAHRLLLLGRHCRDFHRRRLEEAREKGGIGGVFQLDEMETFENSRRLSPVTMPVLIERRSYFVLHAETATLPARGGLSRADQKRKEEREAVQGKRRSGSRSAVERSFAVLEEAHRTESAVLVQTDLKRSYAACLRRRFGHRLLHLRTASTRRRDYGNPLFPINHTLAMMRDGISRLVRRTWAASKLRERLELHAWIWIAWRNYVRGITNEAPGTTPAMALGIATTQWKIHELCARKIANAT